METRYSTYHNGNAFYTKKYKVKGGTIEDEKIKNAWLVKKIGKHYAGDFEEFRKEVNLSHGGLRALLYRKHSAWSFTVLFFAKKEEDHQAIEALKQAMCAVNTQNKKHSRWRNRILDIVESGLPTLVKHKALGKYILVNPHQIVTTKDLERAINLFL